MSFAFDEHVVLRDAHSWAFSIGPCAGQPRGFFPDEGLEPTEYQGGHEGTRVSTRKLERQLNEIAVSDRGTLTGLTQFARYLVAGRL